MNTVHIICQFANHNVDNPIVVRLPTIPSVGDFVTIPFRDTIGLKTTVKWRGFHIGRCTDGFENRFTMIEVVP